MLSNGLSPWHLMLVLAVVILVFGSKKLPDVARGLGQSMRILKAESKAMKEDGKKKDAAADNSTAQQASSEPAAVEPSRIDPPAATTERRTEDADQRPSS